MDENNIVLALNETSIRSLDKKFNVCFSVDPSQTETNFKYDPYFKFYPDSSSPTKAVYVYRIYFTNPPQWTNHKSNWKTSTTMNRATRKLLMDALSSSAIYTYKDESGKEINMSTTVWGALTLFCDQNFGTQLHGTMMPNYLDIEFAEHRSNREKK